MKIKLCIMLTLLSFYLYGEEVHVYSGILEHTFTFGKNTDQLGIITGEDARSFGTESTEPTAMTFNNKNELIINDNINNRVIWYNFDYSVNNIYKDKNNDVSFSYFINDINKFYSFSYIGSDYIFNG